MTLHGAPSSPGLESWDKKASGVMKNQRRMAIPTFRSQINHILMKEKNTDFRGYMHELHTVGQAASKRSTIPNGDMEEAANELHKIKTVCSFAVSTKHLESSL